MAEIIPLRGRYQRHLCLIEDDGAVADSLRVQLTRNGFAVTIFGSAAEFLASGTLDRYDCLIVDQRLPVMSGLELVELLRTRAYSRPVLLIWGQREPQLLARIARAGIRETLNKPLAPSELLAALDRALPELRT
ncbi:MAG: response regulator [Proteobacteria bacterium]|nr:response regulator [Pseudomonadota bacterium]